MCNFPRLITHKANVLFDVLNVFDILLRWIGIIEPQVAFALADLSLHEIKSHSFAVTNVKISVGLRWESRQDNVTKFVYPVLQQLFGVDC